MCYKSCHLHKFHPSSGIRYFTTPLMVAVVPQSRSGLIVTTLIFETKRSILSDCYHCITTPLYFKLVLWFLSAPMFCLIKYKYPCDGTYSFFNTFLIVAARSARVLCINRQYNSEANVFDHTTLKAPVLI